MRRVAMEYLAMKIDGGASAQELMKSDLRELGGAAANLAAHTVMLAGGLGFGTTFFKFLASVAAIYLLILDRTNWKTNILTSLLIPYIFLSLPDVLFNLLTGDAGKWIAFAAIILRLFFPRHFPGWLELPAALILMLVVVPEKLTDELRDHGIGALICLAIACYLLQEHIRASGGFRNSFTQRHGFSNSVGIILLLVYPVWRLLTHGYD